MQYTQYTQFRFIEMMLLLCNWLFEHLLLSSFENGEREKWARIECEKKTRWINKPKKKLEEYFAFLHIDDTIIT